MRASGDPAEAFAAASCAELSVIDVGTRSDHWFPSRLCPDSHSSSTERTGGPETQTQILAVPLGALSQAFHFTQSSQLPQFSLWGGRMQGRGNIEFANFKELYQYKAWVHTENLTPNPTSSLACWNPNSCLLQHLFSEL